MTHDAPQPVNPAHWQHRLNGDRAQKTGFFGSNLAKTNIDMQANLALNEEVFHPFTRNDVQEMRRWESGQFRAIIKALDGTDGYIDTD